MITINQISLRIMLIVGTVLISGCTRALGPNDTDIFGRSQVTKCNLPAGKDVYVTASVMVAFESSYNTLLEASPKVADQKCGKGTKFLLDNIWSRGSDIRQVRECAGPWISADIRCLKNGPMNESVSLDKAEKRCSEIGLMPGTESHKQCVEMSTK
jgi:hypothetical protein